MQDLSNVWNNFYKVKKTTVGPVLERYQTAKTEVQLGVQTLDRNIEPLFDSVIMNLESSAGSFINPRTGIGAGLGCKLIGEDMDILANNVCNMFLPNVYIMLIIFGCLSFAILLSMCFLTCSIARHFDHWIQVNGNVAVKSDSDESPAKSQASKARTATAHSRVPTGSSREILADAEKEINDDKPERKLELKQDLKPAHRRDRYRKRTLV